MLNQFFAILHNKFTNFMEMEKTKSKLFDMMYMCSPKFVRIIFNILKTKGTVMIYSNYVEMEGLQLLKVYLEFFSFVDIEQDQELDKNNLNPKKDLTKALISKLKPRRPSKVLVQFGSPTLHCYSFNPIHLK